MPTNRPTIAKDKPDRKLYQERARSILPILVRQAKARQKIRSCQESVLFTSLDIKSTETDFRLMPNSQIAMYPERNFL